MICAEELSVWGLYRRRYRVSLAAVGRGMVHVHVLRVARCGARCGVVGVGGGQLQGGRVCALRVVVVSGVRLWHLAVAFLCFLSA